MKRNYEGLIVFIPKGGDEAPQELINKIGAEMEKEGAKLQQVDKIGRRKFPYGSKGHSEGYFVSYQFEAEPHVLDKVRNRLRLNPDVHQQYFQVEA